ncbi:Carboxylesterase, partial [Diaporthe sp. PMI_573]
NGTVIRVHDTASGVQKFLGIPFAEPPIGPYRLRQSVPLKKSFDNFQADEFGHSCYSSRVQGNDSEDCLTLNVWRPADANVENDPLPVLVWLYGGGL